ncbi:MAG: hypothetical protein KDB90_08625 [Planctomycetes bacterium]|nr:hypothetical protein [Planctomycetota bacterium]
MDPNSGAARKAAQQMMQASATYSRKDEAAKLKSEKPFPPKARRMAIIFSVLLMGLVGLPAILELSGVIVNIGQWLTLLISIPIMMVAMLVMGFLRDGLTVNVISGVIVLFAAQLAYGTNFDPDEIEAGRALLVRSAGPVITLVMLVYFWIGLKTHLRDLHYMIAEGESMQDIMTRMQQAQVIKKAGGEPVLNEKGQVVDKNDIIPRKGFRPKKGGTAAATKTKKKRKKPKVR